MFFALFCLQLQAECMLKWNNCVYTQIVKHCLADELLPIIRDLSNMSETEFYSAKLYDDWGAYDGLVDFVFALLTTASKMGKGTLSCQT